MTTPTVDRVSYALELARDIEGSAVPSWVPLPHQEPPEPGFYGWLLQAGRGAGKTATCARYVHDHVHGPPCLSGRQPHRVGIIGPTLGDVVEARVLGPYGLRHHDPAAQFRGQPSYQVVWANGSQAMLFGGKNPDDIERLRAKGGNRCLLWFEEMAAIRLLQDAYDIAEPGLRAGDHPHWIASTTPKPRPFITGGPKRTGGLMQRSDVVVTHATTFDNPHLPDVQKERLEERYRGTSIGRQELLGQIVEDVPGRCLEQPNSSSGQPSPERPCGDSCSRDDHTEVARPHRNVREDSPAVAFHLNFVREALRVFVCVVGAFTRVDGYDERAGWNGALRYSNRALEHRNAHRLRAGRIVENSPIQ